MFTVQLPESEWVKVLNWLANYSFKQVAGTISQIQGQLQPQLQAEQKAMAGLTPPPQRPNGPMENVAERN